MAPRLRLSRRLAGSGRNCPCRGAGLRLLATAPAIGQLSLSRDQWSGALPTLGVKTSTARGIRIGGFGVSATGVAAAGSVFRLTALSLVMEDVFRWVSLRWSEGASRAEPRAGQDGWGRGPQPGFLLSGFPWEFALHASAMVAASGSLGSSGGCKLQPAAVVWAGIWGFGAVCRKDL